FFLIINDFIQLVDRVIKFIMFSFQFNDISVCQTVKLKHDNRFSLSFSEMKRFDQIFFCILFIFRFPDQTDDIIQNGKCLHQTFDDMHPLFCLFKFKLRPFINDFLLMIYIACQNLFQSEQFRRPVADCNHIEVIRDLQVRTLVQVVDDAFDVRIFTDFNRYSQALPVGFIPDFQNTVDFSIRTDFINLFDQICLINFEWQLGHCNQICTHQDDLNIDIRTDYDSAASDFISFLQFILPLNDAIDLKIITFHNFKNHINYDSGFIDDLKCRIDDLTKVMGGNIR